MSNYGQVLKHPIYDYAIMVITVDDKGFTAVGLYDNSGIADNWSGQVRENFGGERVHVMDALRSKWLILDD